MICFSLSISRSHSRKPHRRSYRAGRNPSALCSSHFHPLFHQLLCAVSYLSPARCSIYLIGSFFLIKTTRFWPLMRFFSLSPNGEFFPIYQTLHLSVGSPKHCSNRSSYFFNTGNRLYDIN